MRSDIGPAVVGTASHTMYSIDVDHPPWRCGVRVLAVYLFLGVNLLPREG